MVNGKVVLGTIIKRCLNQRVFKFAITLIALLNVFYIAFLLIGGQSSKHFSIKLKTHASNVWDNINIYGMDEDASKDASKASKTPQTATLNSLPSTKKDDKPLFPLPKKPYKELADEEKIHYKLNEVTRDKKKYWLAHTELTDHQLQITVKDFKKEAWKDKPTLFYDPRFTLSIYINEIKNQYIDKNPENDKTKKNEIIVPFAWSDWVDITMLNEELSKSESARKNCEYMKAVHHIKAKDPNYCVNNNDITEQDLEEMKLPSTNFVPGFAVKKSPTNKASNEVRMLEGKSHLLTYAKNPLAIIFLSNDGVYEAQVEGKQRIVDSNLFDRYLSLNNIKEDQIVLDPVKEFNEFVKAVRPNTLDAEDDIYGMVAKIKETDPSKSRELTLTESSFNYQQDKIDAQIQEFEKRIEGLGTITTNELKFDEEQINKLRLSRNEKIYYDGLKYASSFDPKAEETYFRMARLNFDNEENDKDAGWHYEWRFFNGALRYLKKGWNVDELLIREKVLLDRILRNWFRFANEKGITSWIAHGPLLSWYWDGLLFPFDEDIDIQMPAEELARFSRLYNQTLVIEDITEGFGKYFIDCSTFIHHRQFTKNENHIDARFIDIDTGSYIDITGLGISDEEVPEQYKSLSEAARAENVPQPVYNCRNKHFYSFKEISPLRFTMMGGVPLYIPNNIKEILKIEYSKGLTSYTYENFYFVDALNLWIHKDKLEFLFQGQDYKDKDGIIDPEKFTNLVKTIGTKEVVQILERDEDVLLEYYITMDVTALHKKELTFLFDMPQGENTLIGDIGDQKSEEVISHDVEYHKLTSQFKFQKPFRRPLFNYENIDKPKHHKD
ncbi:uncharacterized protein PRCAT00004472001 [Priceomyces carsonii]|uniref:uncharacterized protein n=1 Tax=Priceomyces carsonii TaxID=28549 RepID=UPI002EDB1CC4|nr:unnamed protein product [Priceomyces carsonii]